MLKQIDVLVVPSICFESFSFVTHEALASKTPVIVSNIGALVEYVSVGKNGYTFDSKKQ